MKPTEAPVGGRPSTPRQRRIHNFNSTYAKESINATLQRAARADKAAVVEVANTIVADAANEAAANEHSSEHEMSEHE